VSYRGLVGGGVIPVPGEITLAHNGVLFLDEITEFSRVSLESLRQPLEEGEVTIVRNRRSFKFPADFLLVAARNPCPCGFFGDTTNRCTCSVRSIQRYTARLSGPFLDRIDLHVTVAPLESSQLAELYKIKKQEVRDNYERVKTRIKFAVAIQKKRFKGMPYYSNSRMGSPELKKYCQISDTGKQLLKLAVAKFFLSTRSYIKVLKVSRTIADLEGSADILDQHIAEALQYRVKSS
jgi:magnesium chelatase family protein